MVKTEIRLIIFFVAELFIFFVEKVYKVSKKQDWDLTVAQIMNSLLQNSDLNWRTQKYTRAFRYNVNKITYSTVEVTDRFKRLDLLDGVPEELWTEVRNIVQEVVIKTTPKKKEMRNSKMVVWEGLKNSWEKKRSKMQRRKGKIYPSECRISKNSKER